VRPGASLPRCIIFNKPYGVPSQFSDPAGEFGRTLRDYVQVPDVYPVGRLDRDSEGLLLLTDDGGLQHQLTDPRFAHPKTYLVQVEGAPEEPALESLRRGVVIQGRRTLPAEARLLTAEPQLWPRDPPIRFRKSVPAAWLEIVLREGRNRQIRRMSAAVGLPTLRLVRWALGPLTVEGLDPGEWRELDARDSLALRQMASKRMQRAGGAPGK
jgi:23S rRNA pseudouridine2457 synthase